MGNTERNFYWLHVKDCKVRVKKECWKHFHISGTFRRFMNEIIGHFSVSYIQLLTEQWNSHSIDTCICLLSSFNCMCLRGVLKPTTLHQMITKIFFLDWLLKMHFLRGFDLQNNEIVCDYFLNMQFLCFLMACGWKFFFDVENGIIFC